jgi:8-oxo-dGTP pyrophosphatase MutT (NUDIX family)/O-acetyl-ADP-ribose deacetylase (regulator of RNase III)
MYIVSLNYVIGDATRPVGDGPKIIAHICNDIGGWGQGFVLALSKRWPEPERHYRAWHRGATKIPFTLGEIQLVSVEPALWVANLIGQHDVQPKDGLAPVRYDAVRSGLQKVAAEAKRLNASVHMPRIGCGLAGGSWERVGRIVEEELKGISVTVYDLPAKSHDRSIMKTVLHTGKYLSLIKEGHWEYAERVNATGAAVIVAVTDEQKILLVEQYRIPLHSNTIELPAGIIGDEADCRNESFTDAARRELREETGYDAGQVDILATGPSSGGLTSELVTLFRASRLRRVSAGGGIANEQITVHEVPLKDVHDWLAAKAKANVLVEPKVYTGLYFLLANQTAK